MERRNQLLKKINELETLKKRVWAKLASYDVANNKGLKSLLSFLHESTSKKLEKLYAEYNPIEKKRLEEYKNSPEHKMLMASAGLSGFQILTYKNN